MPKNKILYILEIYYEYLKYVKKTTSLTYVRKKLSFVLLQDYGREITRRTSTES